MSVWDPQLTVRSGELTPAHLPPGPSLLVGRDALVADAVELLRPGTVLTLAGFGGVGKTSVAVEIARAVLNDADNFSDGLWLCELAAVADGSTIPLAVADSIGMFQNEDATAYDSVVSGLRGLWAVLVLDNCEHVIGEAASFVRRLVADCPDLAVIVTSREPLHLEAEHVVVVEPLDVAEESPALFVRRAIASDPSFLRADHSIEIGAICHALDGLPLALELAAAQLTSMSPSELARRLGERFRTLRTTHSTGRSDSLYATVQWSYDLLGPVERHLFDRLSVFQGGFDDEAAAALVDPRDPSVDVAAVLAALVDKSMVGVRAGGSEETGSRRRYEIPETLREFGDRQLARRNERSAVRNQHLDHVVEIVATANAFAMSNDWSEGARRIAQEWGNIRAAVNWAIDTTRVDDVDRLLRDVFFYCRWNLEAEAAVWAERALTRVRTAGAVAGTPVYLHVAFRHFLTGEHAGSLATLQDGLTARGTPSDRGWCRHYAAVELLYLGRAEEAADQAALDFVDESPRPVESVMRSSSLTVFESYAGRIAGDELSERLDRDIARAEATSNAVAIGLVTYNRALVAYARGDVDSYLADMRAALKLARVEGISNLTGYVLTAQVYAPGWSGLRAALDALEYWASKRDIGNEFVVLEAVAINLAELGRLEPAAVVLGNLAKDRRRIASSAGRRKAALDEIGLQPRGETWLAAGAAMPRGELLRFTKSKVLEALGSM